MYFTVKARRVQNQQLWQSTGDVNSKSRLGITFDELHEFEIKLEKQSKSTNCDKYKS